MIISGMCSISFRALDCDEIIDLAVRGGLGAIEWGGDVHCPHGDVDTAAKLAAKCADRGLACPSYGSYYRLLDENSPDFAAVADTAKALGAGTIRIWAGTKSPQDADEEYWESACKEAGEIARTAADRGCGIAFEYHGNSLTETRQSTAKFCSMLPGNDIRFYWQPPHGDSVEECLAGISDILPRLSNLHVFHWGAKGWTEKHLLSDGKDRWEKYLAAADAADTTRYAYLEFSKDDSPENLLQDAATLNEIISKLKK